MGKSSKNKHTPHDSTLNEIVARKRKIMENFSFDFFDSTSEKKETKKI
jgi:hypothetical protein